MSVCDLRYRTFILNISSKRSYKSAQTSPDLILKLDAEISDQQSFISDVNANITIIYGNKINPKKTTKIPYYGITFKNQSFFVLVGTFSRDDEINYIWARRFFKNCSIKMHDGKIDSLYFNHKKTISQFVKEYPNDHITFRIITLSFKVFMPQQNANNNNMLTRFARPYLAKGHLYEGLDKNLHVSGYEYDSVKFSIEARLYFVLIGVCISFSFYAWFSLKNYIKTQAHISSVSFLTLLIVFALDISICLDFNIANDCLVPPTLLSMFLFFSHLMIYLVLQFPIIVNIFKQQNILQIPISKLAVESMLFFIILFSAHNFHHNRIFEMIVASMQWIPQIYKNMKFTQRKGICKTFVLLVSINRILLFIYSDCYYYNIYETKTINNFSLPSFLIAFQALFLIFQEKYGPYFFLPSILKPKPFNYRSTIPEPGTECVICYENILETDDSAVTPCNHAFHMACLSRWMEEKQQCPICRNQIPPIDENLF